jgi:hypothetical protein
MRRQWTPDAEQKRHGQATSRKQGTGGFFRSRGRRGFPRLSETAEGKTAGVAPADFDTAKTTNGVGALQETLKWGQPSYLTAETKSGSTIRIDRVKSAANEYAVYFHCQTDLVETFRELYPTQLRYSGNRSIVLNAADRFPETELRHCVALALTYHLRKRQTANRRP